MVQAIAEVEPNFSHWVCFGVVVRTRNVDTLSSQAAAAGASLESAASSDKPPSSSYQLGEAKSRRTRVGLNLIVPFLHFMHTDTEAPATDNMMKGTRVATTGHHARFAALSPFVAWGGLDQAQRRANPS